MESSCIKVYPSQAKNTVSRGTYGQSPYYIFQQITSKMGTEIYATYVLHSGKSFQKWLKQSNFLHQGHWRKLGSLQWQNPWFPKQKWSGITNCFGWSLKRESGRAGSANQIWSRQGGSSSRLFFSTSALTLEWWWAQVKKPYSFVFFSRFPTVYNTRFSVHPFMTWLLVGCTTMIADASHVITLLWLSTCLSLS